MLSIRTQDRMCLLPYDDILAIKKDHAINAYSLETCEIHKGYSVVCDKGILGTYATKKRALEVLDEIEIAIIGKILIPTPVPKDYMPKPFSVMTTSPNGAIELLPLVYEMPKEWIRMYRVPNSNPYVITKAGPTVPKPPKAPKPKVGK